MIPVPYLASFSLVPALLGEILVDLPQPLVFNQVVLGEGRHFLGGFLGSGLWGRVSGRS